MTTTIRMVSSQQETNQRAGRDPMRCLPHRQFEVNFGVCCRDPGQGVVWFCGSVLDALTGGELGPHCSRSKSTWTALGEIWGGTRP